MTREGGKREGDTLSHGKERQERGRHLVSGGDFGCDGKRLPKAVAQLDELFLVHRDLQEHSEHRRLIALESGGALHRVCTQRACGFESLKVSQSQKQRRNSLRRPRRRQKSERTSRARTKRKLQMASFSTVSRKPSFK